MLLLAFLACDATIEGELRGDDGTPVVGARLAAGEGEDACVAVTGVGGAFRARCTPGPRSFAVSHPDYLPGTWEVADIPRGEVAVGAFTLTRIPREAGLWALGTAGFVSLEGAALRRTVEGDLAQRWCVDPAAPAVQLPAGSVRLLDARGGAEWRAYRLDSDGCAYRMSRGGAEHWSFSATRMESGARTPISEGRDWVELSLPPGDYAVVDWYEGFFVRDDAAADTWRAAHLRAG